MAMFHGSKRTSGLTRWAIRLTLAYALLLQGVLGAAAGTLHALSAGDAMAGVLCTPSGQGDAGQGNPSHDLLCCTLGCAAAQPAPSLGGAAPLRLPSPPTAQLGVLLPYAGAAQAGLALISFEARGPPARA